MLKTLELIKQHREFLIEHIDPDFGLLDKLAASGILSNREISDIKIQPTFYQRNSALLGLILKNDAYDSFLTTLKDSSQNHIVNYVIADGERKSENEIEWPLTEKEIFILRVNQESLVDLLDSDELTSRLYSTGVLNRRQRVFINAKATEYEKNEALLDILRRGSLASYWQTIRCLHATKQSAIAEILQSGGVVARLDVALEAERLNIDEAERSIVSEITKLLTDSSLQETNRILEHVKNLKLIAARQGHSIRLYFLCHLSSDANALHEMITDGRLKDVLESLFTLLARSSKRIRVSFKFEPSLLTQLHESFKDFPVSFPVERVDLTSITVLPLCLLETVLRKAHMMLNCEEKAIVEFLGSINFSCYYILTRKRFKNAYWTQLSKINAVKYGLLHCLRDNQQFLEENVQLSLRLSDSVKAINFLKRDKCSFSKNRRRHHQFSCSTIQMKYCNNDLLGPNSIFTEIINKAGHNRISKLFDCGGAVVKIKIQIRNSSEICNWMHHFRKQLCELQDKTQSKPQKVQKVLIELEDNDMEILNSEIDRDPSIWFWCKSPRALETIMRMNASGNLLDIFRRLAERRGPSISQIEIEMDSFELRKKFTYFPEAFIVSRKILNLRKKITETDGRIYSWGVAKLHSELYILCSFGYYVSTVIIFSDHPPFLLQNRIELMEMKDPTDLGSCAIDNSLYAIDNFQNGNNCIWKIQRKEEAVMAKQMQYKVTKWLEFEDDFRPRTLSVTSEGQLLVVSRYPPFDLRLYGSKAEQCCSIQLMKLNVLFPCHAVATSTGNFLILHRKEKKQNKEMTHNDHPLLLSEIDPNGNSVVRHMILENKPCNEESEVGLFYTDNNSGYLCSFWFDGIFAADTNNKTVNLLNYHFRSNQLLFPDIPTENNSIQWPRRLFYDKFKRQLFIVGGYHYIHCYNLAE